MDMDLADPNCGNESCADTERYQQKCRQCSGESGYSSLLRTCEDTSGIVCPSLGPDQK